MAFDGRTDCHLGGRMKRKVHYTKSLNLLNYNPKNLFELFRFSQREHYDWLNLFVSAVPVVVTNTCPIMKTQKRSKMKISSDGSSRDVCR
jgi:hypothetical protein